MVNRSNDADLRICLPEMPKDLQLSIQAGEPGPGPGLSAMW